MNTSVGSIPDPITNPAVGQPQLATTNPAPMYQQQPMQPMQPMYQQQPYMPNTMQQGDMWPACQCICDCDCILGFFCPCILMYQSYSLLPSMTKNSPGGCLKQADWYLVLYIISVVISTIASTVLTDCWTKEKDVRDACPDNGANLFGIDLQELCVATKCGEKGYDRQASWGWSFSPSGPWWKLSKGIKVEFLRL